MKSSLDIFRHWHCLGVTDKINFARPYIINVGDLPLAIWKNPVTQQLSSVINVCRHMGSKLDNAVITDKGCLKCQYHGLEMSDADTFGEVVDFQGKLFWAYDPICPSPPKVPFYDNPSYMTSHLVIDMGAGLLDSALNTMDIRHPEYVHRLGFGSNRSPTNIQQYLYKDARTKLPLERIGLSFDYSSNPVMSKLHNDMKTTKNFHMYVYPTFSWSRVSFQGPGVNENNHLVIGVNLLPLEPQKTRWFITICHNYYVSELQRKFVQMMAATILSQDYAQMNNQYLDNNLKRTMMLDHRFPDEEVVVSMRDMFKQYRYPTIDMCTDLYKDYKMRNKLSKLSTDHFIDSTLDGNSQITGGEQHF
jgi:phenylpropionate dioxygenase-like ring-hydroxylating dioxygenase large terminal subunit